MMKILIGGSPCTHWSIAQTKNRETQPEGLGWELFKNYLIALEKFKPDYFLYENNKSMSKAIRAQITKELGVEPILINSALVSAQSRQRLYWVGKQEPDGTYSRVSVKQPEDKGILLRDILESGIVWKEKAYCLAANRGGHSLAHDLEKSKYDYVAYPVSVTKDGKSYTLKANYSRASAVNALDGGHFPAPMAAEPVRIGTIESDAKNADFDSQQYRVYSPDGKGVTLCGQGGGVGAKTGLYAVPVDLAGFAGGEGAVYPITFDAEGQMTVEIGGRTRVIYEVRDGRITIKGQQYPIKLMDSYYIIRKLTVTECKRLQTVPEEYIFPVSDTQAYKMLGNGWTVDVIAHILHYAPGITEEPLEVLSMYDGMSCGHLALDKLGAHIAHYYATEIDKYAIQTTQYNFPDTIQLGDAFQVRSSNFWPKLN